MSEHKKGRNAKGYYIALVLCAAAIWITGYVVYRNDRMEEEASLSETYQDTLVGTLGNEDVAVIATEPTPQPTIAGKTPAPKPPAGTKETKPQETVKEPLKTTSPVAGSEISGYSMEALSYNQTTRDWRVHNGIDLAAEAGAEVAAAAEGEVYTVYEDDYLGSTVVIRHRNGYTTRYCSLAEDIPVKPGDQVTMGQTIGYASDSAIVESTLGAHVHFSVTRYDEPMDPAEFLSLG